MKKLLTFSLALTMVCSLAACGSDPHSGSSGIGSSAADLHDLTTDATWLDGHRFSGSASQADVQTWVDGLGLNLSEKE